MSIVSMPFFGFVSCTIFVFYIVPKRIQNVVLLAASYGFCLTFGWPCFFLLLTSTVFNFLLPVFYSPGRRNPKNLWIVWLGVTVNLAGLIWLRRATLPSDVMEADSSLLTISGVGMSFYTLSAIAYLVDVYRGQVTRVSNLLHFALFMAWFPKLLSGPIERVQVLLPQLTASRIVDDQHVMQHLSLIFVGVFRKVVIANWLFALLPSNAWTQPDQFHTFELIIFPFLFAVAVYNDFLGYMSIMRGVSGLFGIKLSRNFQLPLSSRSFTEFWTRWHITFSEWLRDYMFFPLTRYMLKRKLPPQSLAVISLPLLLTMLGSGLWHGFGWNFITWGAVIGCVQIGERIHAVGRTQASIQVGSRLLYITAVLAVIPAAVCFNTSLSNTFDYCLALVEFSMKLYSRNRLAIFLLWLVPPLLANIVLDRMDESSDTRSVSTAFPAKLRPLAISVGVFLILVVSQANSHPAFVYEEF